MYIQQTYRKKTATYFSIVLLLSTVPARGMENKNNTQDDTAFTLTGLYNSARRAYDTRYNDAIQREMLGLKENKEEYKKTQKAYTAVENNFGNCSQDELDLFAKRACLALQYAHNLCGLQECFYSTNVLDDIRNLQKNNASALPPSAVTNLQEKEKQITEVLENKIRLHHRDNTQEQLALPTTPRSQKKLIDDLIKCEAINADAYKKEIENKQQELIAKAQQEAEEIVNRKHIAAYFQNLKIQN